MIRGKILALSSLCMVKLFFLMLALLGWSKDLPQETDLMFIMITAPLKKNIKLGQDIHFILVIHLSNSFFTARVFSEYLSNNTTQVLIWSAAALIPAVTGFSRVNTHNHFPTDVIVGYIVGAAIGYLIPKLHKYENKNEETVTPDEFIHKPILGFQLSF